jgi:hypothetical protein
MSLLCFCYTNDEGTEGLCTSAAIGKYLYSACHRPDGRPSDPNWADWSEFANCFVDQYEAGMETCDDLAAACE